MSTGVLVTALPLAPELTLPPDTLPVAFVKTRVNRVLNAQTAAVTATAVAAAMSTIQASSTAAMQDVSSSGKKETQ